MYVYIGLLQSGIELKCVSTKSRRGVPHLRSGNTYIRPYIYICVNVYIYVRIYICMYIYIWHLQSCVEPKCVCTEKSPRCITSRLWNIYVCVYVCIYIYIYVCVYVCIYILLFGIYTCT